MRIISRQKDNYFVKMSQVELLTIVFGKTYPQYDESTKKECNNFLNRIRTEETEVKISERYTRIIDIFLTRINKEYDSITKQLEKLIESFSPVEDFIRKVKDEAMEESGV